MKMTFNKKTTILIPFLVLITVLFTYYPGFTRFFASAPPLDPQYLIDERNDIIGTFKSEEDANWTMVFSGNGKCYNYYNGTLTSTSSYLLSNTTPQCGTDVLIDENESTSYLTLTDDSDGISICYEINGVGSELTLTVLSTQNLLILDRQ